MSEGLKYDGGKPDFSLISPLALSQLAQVLTFGAKKYAAHNWRRGIKMSRLLAAANRHLMAIQSGIDHDNETNLLHAAHLMCTAMFIIEQSISPHCEEFDDRFQYSSEQKIYIEALLNNLIVKENLNV